MNYNVSEFSLNHAEKTQQKFFSRKSLSDINPEFFQGNFHKNIVHLSDRNPDPQDYFITLPHPILLELLDFHKNDSSVPLTPTMFILSLIYKFLENNYHTILNYNNSHTLSYQKPIPNYSEISYEFLRTIYHKPNDILNWLEKYNLIQIQGHSFSSKLTSKNANHARRFIPKDGLAHIKAKTNFTQFHLPELIKFANTKDKTRIRLKEEKIPSTFVLNPLRMQELHQEIATYKTNEINAALRSFDPELNSKEDLLSKINQKYENLITQVSKLPNEVYLVTDKFGHRRHTLLTSLPKYTRKYLIDLSVNLPVDKRNKLHELMSFDLKASLPCFLGVVTYGQEAINQKDYPDHASFAEAKLYFTQCRSKLGIYNYIKRRMIQVINDKGIYITDAFTHKDIKAIYIQYLSARNDLPLEKIKNKYGNYYSKELINVFLYTMKSVFPTIVRYLTDLKQEDHKKVTSLLQRHESSFIHSCHKFLSRHGIPCTTIYDAILVPRKYKKETAGLLAHMIQESGIPTRFVPEEISRIKTETAEFNENIADQVKSNADSLAKKVAEILDKKLRIGGLRKLVLDQAKEDLFEFSLLTRSSRRKKRSVNEVVAVDSAIKIKRINEIVDPNNDLMVEVIANASVVFQKGQRQEKTREKNKTISIPTGSQPYNFDHLNRVTTALNL